jgi:hypothetical protein
MLYVPGTSSKQMRASSQAQEMLICAPDFASGHRKNQGWAQRQVSSNLIAADAEKRRDFILILKFCVFADTCAGDPGAARGRARPFYAQGSLFKPKAAFVTLKVAFHVKG